MTTTHSDSPPAQRARAPSRGAGARARLARRRRDWSEWLARIVCLLLAGVGTLPFLTTLVVRSAWARDWAARTARRLIETQHVEAEFAPSVRVWPLALELDRVRIDSNDGGAPVLDCARILVRPKLFALLAGKLAIDAVDLDTPRVRAVLRDGKIANLDLAGDRARRASP